MKDLIVITPVKNSLDTLKKTIDAIEKSSIDISYFIYNDFSDEETEHYLNATVNKEFVSVIHLKDHVSTPSPNYRTVLLMAQKTAIQRNAHLVIIESDVIVSSDTLKEMQVFAESTENCGMVGAITVDSEGKINFPYNHVNDSDSDVINTTRSLSFCCTLITNKLLHEFDLESLSIEKDWYDVFISKKSRALGFKNYLLKGLPVIHAPHSSRPWKNEKYSNPISYYFKKMFFRRDKI